MTRKTAQGHPRSNTNRALLDACIHFDDQIKAFIKNARNDQDTAHLAAQVLFEVRRLENALSPADKREKSEEQAKRVTVTVIPPVDTEDL